MTIAAKAPELMKPAKAIRRFDVLAEYTRQERRAKGDPDDVAKGYGIWLAKVVASRRFGVRADQDHHGGSNHRTEPVKAPRFRSVGNELQTDEIFDQDIVNRMGAAFYREVFVPEIEAARKDGKSYESIRDAIRKAWKPSSSE